MYKLLFMISIFLIACNQVDTEKQSQTFGAEITMTEEISLADIYQDPERFNEKEILVRGTITEVCQKKGCWMKITDGTNVLTVRFKDYAFFVPKDAASSRVNVQGIFKNEVDEHIAEEAHSQADSTRHTDMDVEPSYTLTASAVEIRPVVPTDES